MPVSLSLSHVCLSVRASEGPLFNGLPLTEPEEEEAADSGKERETLLLSKRSDRQTDRQTGRQSASKCCNTAPLLILVFFQLLLLLRVK